MCPIPPSIPKSSLHFARKASCSRKLLFQGKKKKRQWQWLSPSHHHVQWRRRPDCNSGQSNASQSEQPCPEEMGHFVPSDKTDPSYLHSTLPVPQSLSPRSLAEAFPPALKDNPYCIMENRAAAALCWSCCRTPQSSGAVRQGRRQRGRCSRQHRKRDFLCRAHKQLTLYSPYFSIWFGTDATIAIWNQI